MRIDPQIIAELSADMPAVHGGDDHDAMDREVAETAARMLRLLDRPSSIPVLQHQLRREMHYWLLAGRHGAWLRRAVPPKRHADQIARAVALLRSEFRSPLASERLAAAAGMGLSNFYQSFRDVTSVSPLQYQKRLRLSEARRLLLGKRMRVSDAAFAVGYESVSQFVREYRRTFGSPPGREAAEARRRAG